MIVDLTDKELKVKALEEFGNKDIVTRIRMAEANDLERTLFILLENDRGVVANFQVLDKKGNIFRLPEQ